MLKEITNLNETSDNLKRRWFTDSKLDLYVWQDHDGAILEFQFGYNKPDDEYIVRWTRDNGLSHHKIQSGETGPYDMDASPILGEPVNRTPEQARKLFVSNAIKLEHDLYEFIVSKLDNA